MNSILLAIAIVSGLGLISGLGLSVAAAMMDEPVDERVERLTAALPGYNCGVCGYPSCAGYDEAIVNEGAARDLCKPGRDATIQAIEEVLA